MSAKVADNAILDEKEKVSIEQRSPAESLDAHDDDSELLAPEVRQVAERHLVRVLDSRLMPTIIVIFLMNYIDVSLCKPQDKLPMVSYTLRTAPMLPPHG